MRILSHLPIIHSTADLGSLAGPIRDFAARTLGASRARTSVRQVDRFWAALCQEVRGWDLLWPRVRIYQDGLPVCGREEEIVKTLADAGSENHRLLLDLMGRGAVLTGTESPDLLVKEYNFIRQIALANDLREATHLAEQQRLASHALLEQRDDFIARRIDETLEPGWVGVIFLGMMHSLEGRLPADIEVSHPLERPGILERFGEDK